MKGVLYVSAALALGLWGLYFIESPLNAMGEGRRNVAGRKGDIPVMKINKVVKSDAEWKKVLTPMQYNVARKKGTERPFSGEFYKHHEPGTYVCAACDLPLFSSKTKYDSGSGWPSYYAPIQAQAVPVKIDRTGGMVRKEILCAKCDAHLGHVFDDGPQPTGLRYCVNSAILKFQPEQTDVSGKLEVATFAAGCFWGIEAAFRTLQGVVDTSVGFTGGNTRNPSYREVCRDNTGHAEAVRILFDPARVTYEQLVDKFLSCHDPTQYLRQGPDVGSQYRSAIFYHNKNQEDTARDVIARSGKSGAFKKPIVTEVVKAGPFYMAEEYHQRYLEKKGQAHCSM